LTACICVSSSLLNCTHIWLSFSTPTPCSPVTVPPTSTQSSRMSPAELLGALQLARDVGIVEDQRVQVAVAGVEDVGDRSPYWPDSSAMRFSTSAAARGMVPSMQ
jgi:hypothetical protein